MHRKHKMLQINFHIPKLIFKSSGELVGKLELRAKQALLIEKILLSIDNQSLPMLELQGPMELSELTVWELPFALKFNTSSSGKSFFPQLLGTGKPTQLDFGKMLAESQLEIVARVILREEEELSFRQTVELW